jgi:hypothetical protein
MSRAGLKFILVALSVVQSMHGPALGAADLPVMIADPPCGQGHPILRTILL